MKKEKLEFSTFHGLKKGEDVNFRAEIDELCLDSTFACTGVCSTSYDFDDQDTLLIPTNSYRDIATTITSNSSCLFYDNNALLDLDLDLDEFYVENLSTMGAADQSSDVHQLKVINKIEDEQLKFQVDDQQLVDPKDGT